MANSYRQDLDTSEVVSLGAARIGKSCDDGHPLEGRGEVEAVKDLHGRELAALGNDRVA